jgi:hypothetical protein
MFYTQNELRALDLPEDDQQCIHASLTEHGVQYCNNRATMEGPNGWVCQLHQPTPARVTPAPRDYDKEVIDSILLDVARYRRDQGNAA